MTENEDTNAEIVNDPAGNEVTKTNTNVTINFNFPFCSYPISIADWLKLFIPK